MSKVGIALVGWLVAACGSSSDSSLFGNAGEAVCSPPARCVSPGAGGIGGGQGTGGAAAGGSRSASGGETGAGGEVGGRGASTGGMIGAGGDLGTGGDLGAGGQLGAGGSRPVTCPAGDYHAVLTGPYRSSLGSNDIGATIDFSVTSSGAVTGSFVGRGTAKATVMGSLDCSSGALTATIEDGSYTLGLTTARFSGSFDGTYDAGTSAFDGTWNITETGSTTNGGTGPWTTQ